ncbi:MAG TPA: hypothetical protein VFS43_34585 [Polyangiaceae bacterium]|nr:hypothetical protein [Polyangiaceae bacterium]
MRTHARRFRSIVHRHPSLPPRPSLAPHPGPAVPPCAAADEPAPPARGVKAWLRLGAHALLAALWVTLPQFVSSRARPESEPLVVEVDRPCPCGRAASAHGGGPSLRDILAPNDDAAGPDEAAGFVGAAPARPRPVGSPRGACDE